MFIRILYFAAFLLLICPETVFGQKLTYNKSYIEDHSKDFIIKFFGGTKFSGYKIDQRGGGNAVVYKSNDNISTGIGFSYRFLGLSIAFRAPVLNNDNVRYGKTKALDLQSSFYNRKYTLDVYGQFYQGLYLKNADILASPLPQGTMLIRPDLKTSVIGLNTHYIFNYKRFSYRAAYVQNEYQKKSAGSALAGISIYRFGIDADSGVIPSDISDYGLFNNSRFNRSRIFSLAVNAGYAYTRVLKKHFFITAALIGGIGSNWTSLTDERLNIEDKKTNWQINGTLRLAAGYNSKRYFAGLQYFNFLTKNASPFSNSWQEFESGYVRFTVAKRFGVKKNMIKEVYNEVSDNVPFIK